MVRIQPQSTGIQYEQTRDEWITCVFEEYRVHDRDETYVFRCPTNKRCCADRCCEPISYALPPWAWIVIWVLVALLLLLLLCLISYFLYRLFCKRRKTVTATAVKPRPAPVMATTVTDSLSIARGGSGIHPYTLLPDRSSTVTQSTQSQQTEQQRHIAVPPRQPTRQTQTQEPVIFADPMEITELPDPQPIQINYNDPVSQEQTPLVMRTEMPEEQKARVIYYRPATDEVAAY